MSSQSTVTLRSYPWRASHSSQIRSTTGSSPRRMAVSSLVIMSACCVLIRSVDDQLNPNRKGGMPVRATSCSRICRTGTSLSSTWLSAPITLMSTSPTATKSRTRPSRPASMAADHSRAIWRLRSWAMDCSRGASPGL